MRSPPAAPEPSGRRALLACLYWLRARSTRTRRLEQPAAPRHLGLDLGGTNTKWAVVEHDGDDWRALATGQGATPAAEGPDAVVGSLASMGSEVMDQVPGVESVGIGVPGL